MTLVQANQHLYKYLSPWDPSDHNAYVPPLQVVSCVIQKDDKLLVLQRARKDQQHKLWGIPGGKLERGETPLQGLIRELQEELSIGFTLDAFQLLGTVLSRTSADGQYGLYVYYAKIATDLPIHIDLNEHYAFQWTTLEEFLALDLLIAQREAFMLVYEKLLPYFKPGRS